MDKKRWKEIVGKTKWASGKKRFSKKELSDLMSNVLVLEKFTGNNRSEFANADRRDYFKKLYDNKELLKSAVPKGAK